MKRKERNLRLISSVEVILLVPRMAGCFIDIQLEVLVVEQEATSSLENCHMVLVFLRQHIAIVSLCQCCFYFNNLTLKLRSPNCVCVAPASLEWKQRLRSSTIGFSKIKNIILFGRACGVSLAFWDRSFEGSREQPQSLEIQVERRRRMGADPSPKT